MGHERTTIAVATEADPLSLELRVSARLSNELLYCITSITPRARYYAFFPWALQDYNERERLTKNDRGRIQGVFSRRRNPFSGRGSNSGFLPHDLENALSFNGS